MENKTKIPSKIIIIIIFAVYSKFTRYNNKETF